MTQGSLLAVSERQELTPDRLKQALVGRGWILRAQIALELGCAVRTVRKAAHESSGAILSSSRGLKLTVDASEDEINEALGRFTSQIHEMSARVAATRDVWDASRPHVHLEILRKSKTGQGWDAMCECGAFKYFSVQKDSWIWKRPEGV